MPDRVRTPQPSLLRPPAAVVELHPSASAVRYFHAGRCPASAMADESPSIILQDTAATIRAFFRNQERWLERLATGQSHPETPHTRIRHDETVTTVRTGRSGVMSMDVTDPASVEDLPAIERSWSWLRSYGQHDLLLWAMTDRRALTLALLARGFEPSFQPTWMARELAGDILDTSLPQVTIRPGTPPDLDELGETGAIPYLVQDQLATTRMLAFDGAHPVVTWLVARDGAGVVGQAIVNLTGPVAGLFNVAVHPRARRRGIGRALTTEAMRIAQGQGAEMIGLNATPDGLQLYIGLGFQRLGKGMTWLMPSRRSRMVPDSRMVRIAEAVGNGETALLKETTIPARLPNGDLPVQFAARFGQSDTVRWLLERGAQPDVLALWDTGLREDAVRAMALTDVLDRPSGPYRATPLHHAIERDDVILAELLIAAGADLAARDTQFRATPLEWAEYLDRPEMAAMIRSAVRR